LKHLLRQASIERDERRQDMSNAPLGVAFLADYFLRIGEDLLGLLGESVLSHHGEFLRNEMKVNGLRSAV
jgi:hypothetical protein